MSRKTRSLLIYLVSLLLAGSAGFLLRQHYGFFIGEADTVIGRVERVYIRDARFGTPGRMDTGAGVTSLGVEIVEIKKPKKEGDPERVVFRMLDEKADIQTLARDIIDWQNIKKKGGKGFLKRPVVMLDLCIAGKPIEARVNLADRTHYLYPILIGRNTLKAGDFMVDPAQAFTHHAMCR